VVLGSVPVSRIDAMDARVLQAKGINYVMRRIDDSFQKNAEATTETEMRVLEEHELKTLLYYMRTEWAAYESRDQGIEDGGYALACARIVGYQVGLPIFFPNGSPEYFRGLRDAMGDYHPIGIIGTVHDAFYVREESNGSTGEGKLDRLQMA
jgi:hypothetical protein